MKTTLQQVLLGELDQRLSALQGIRREATCPSGGWIRAVRQALGLAQATVAKKSAISQQAFAQLERGEAAGTITLGNLQRAAEAMECTLVYFVVPHSTRANSFTGLAAALDPNFVHLQATEHSMALEGQAVGDLPRKSGGPVS